MAPPNNTGVIRDAGDLGIQIRQRRKALSLTQRDAAGLCGVGERFLSEIERGKPSASLGKTLLVAQRLGLQLTVKAAA
jgi:HTH-type transcriptional regulator/antitoxin HipB